MAPQTLADHPYRVPQEGPADEVPLERLESEITELAAHIHAATCRFLLLVEEFDRRLGWQDWGCTSCAQWLSWRCGLSFRGARDQVRVARKLAEFPSITAAFRSGELSYSKVRALVRIATPETEADLLGIARAATAVQIEGLSRSYRRAVAAEELAETNSRHSDRHLIYYYDDYGMLVIEGRLSPEEGALVVKAIEAAAEESGSDEDGTAVPLSTSQRNADGLAVIADNFLATGEKTRSGGDRYQVMVHIDETALRDDAAAAMSHLEGGPSLAPETGRRLTCDASIVTLVERDGEPLSVGRKTRSVPPAIRRALNARDEYCMFPGCNRRDWVDAHHIQHWSKGGETSLANLIKLCRFHHRCVHEGGYRVNLDHRGVPVFQRPDGTPIPFAPATRASSDIVQLNQERGLSIDDSTCVTQWAGDSMDYSDAVDALLSTERVAGSVPYEPGPAPESPW